MQIVTCPVCDGQVWIYEESSDPPWECRNCGSTFTESEVLHAGEVPRRDPPTRRVAQLPEEELLLDNLNKFGNRDVLHTPEGELSESPGPVRTVVFCIGFVLGVGLWCVLGAIDARQLRDEFPYANSTLFLMAALTPLVGWAAGALTRAFVCDFLGSLLGVSGNTHRRLNRSSLAASDLRKVRPEDTGADTPVAPPGDQPRCAPGETQPQPRAALPHVRLPPPTE